MAEQSQTLYRKWRSQTFNELIGQDSISQTLRKALTANRLAHAYLFCGPRGTGKTSSARLLAKIVNCQNPQNGEPCNTCISCREITEGMSTDVFEIDAASNRGIDEIRDLRDRARVSSGIGKTRFYIIDEAHMLTTEAFNALLKTLEEPPPHVIFVLATTEANKIPATVLSRCQRFDFRRIPMREIANRLAYVAQQEQIPCEPAALEIIARAAQGGMRDALSLLDQARAFSADTVTVSIVRSMLGMTDPSLIRDLARFIAQNDAAAGLRRIYDLTQSGVDPRQIATQLTELWRWLALARANADLKTIVDISDEEAQEVQEIAALFELPVITRCARVFSGDTVGPRSLSVPQLAVELDFLDCIHIAHLPAQPMAPTPEASTKTPSAPPARADVSRAPVKKPASQPNSEQQTEPISLHNPQKTDAAPRSSATETAAPSQAAAQNQHTGGNFATHNTADIHSDELLERARDSWGIIQKIIHQKDKPTEALLRNAKLFAADTGDPAVLYFQASKIFVSKLQEINRKQIIENSIKEVLQVPCLIQLMTVEEGENMLRLRGISPTKQSVAKEPPIAEKDLSPAHSAATPGQSVSAIEEQPEVKPAPTQQQGNAPQSLIDIARQDPVVRAVSAEFDAEIIHVAKNQSE